MFHSNIVAIIALILASMMQVSAGGISVPEGNVEVIKVIGFGTQNYVCKSGNWTFVDPLAILYDYDNPSNEVGRHFFNPQPDDKGGKIVFEIKGSQAVLKPIDKIDSENPKSIPEVLLEATNTTPGEMQAITYGQRLNTIGGIAPSTTCTEGEPQKVLYSAEYHFFQAKE